MSRIKGLSGPALLCLLIVILAAGCNCRDDSDDITRTTEDWSPHLITELGMSLTIPPDHVIKHDVAPDVIFEARDKNQNSWIVIRTEKWNRLEKATVESLMEWVQQRPEAMDGVETPKFWSNSLCGNIALKYKTTSMERNDICYGMERVVVINDTLVNVLFCSGDGPPEGDLADAAEVVLGSVNCDVAR